MTVREGTAARVTLTRAAVLLALAAGLAAVHLPGRPPTLCFLRATTGLPCPLCGSTTALVELGRAAPLRAFLASPLAALAAVVLVLRPLLAARLPRLRSKTQLWALIVAGAAAAELWQLHRFGWI